MRVDLDAKIVTRDGKEAGSVNRVIVDPSTNEVVAFVVSTGGLLGKDVVVPREDLDRASPDGDRLRLHLTKSELHNLPAFYPTAYSVPPAAWIPPTGLGYPGSAYLWPLAAAPEVFDARSRGMIEERNITVGKGAPVRDRNGDAVGVVEDVRLDPGTGEIRGVVVKVGGALQTLFGGGRAMEVPYEDIVSVDQNTVRLRLEKGELDQAA